MTMAARRSRDGCRERRLTHRLPFPDRRTTEGEDSSRHVRPYPCPTSSSVASSFPPRYSRSSPRRSSRRRRPRARRRRRAARRSSTTGTATAGSTRSSRALLPRRDPIAPGRREGLLERRGGHSAGARLRAAAQGGPRPDGRPRADRHGRRPIAGTADDAGDRQDPTVPTAPRATRGARRLRHRGVDTSGPSSVPIPLLILGGLALLLLAAGGAGYLSRRAQARRNGGPPGPA